MIDSDSNLFYCIPMSGMAIDVPIKVGEEQRTMGSTPPDGTMESTPPDGLIDAIRIPDTADHAIYGTMR